MSPRVWLGYIMMPPTETENTPEADWRKRRSNQFIYVKLEVTVGHAGREVRSLDI